MKLKALLDELPEKHLASGYADMEINGVAYDSRKVAGGHLFVAIKGYQADGHDFILDAAARGAAAVIADESHRHLSVPPGLTLVTVPDSRRALSRLAAAYYGFPGRQMRVVGITGTNGKTTTGYLLSAILEAAGQRTGMLGSIELKVGDRILYNESRRTTQESLDTQQWLAEMVRAGVDTAIVESTSHGLALGRVADCDFDVAIFTNLTRDHFDFHKTREQYLADKSLLFRYLAQAADKGFPKASVLNVDDESIDTLCTVASGRLITYGMNNPADVSAHNVTFAGFTPSFQLDAIGRSSKITLGMPGRHNIYNALAATSAALALGVDLDVIVSTLSTFSGVRGRLERIDEGQEFLVFVDYAHTPDGLKNVLETARLQAGQHRVILVFGAAGGRDRDKRPEMGALGHKLSDFCIVTNEDPVNEDPGEIIAQVESGVVKAGGRIGADYSTTLDRREAIRMALSRAQRGDVVLITGKGHERSMSVGTSELPWDDGEVVRQVLSELSRGRTP